VGLFRKQIMTPYQAAEKMQTAFCQGDFPNVSNILGSDWASGRNLYTAQAYKRAAYETADAKFGELPFRHESE
jgi:hypothetical protein